MCLLSILHLILFIDMIDGTVPVAYPLSKKRIGLGNLKNKS